ncbi:MAG: glutamate 5-kinase [Methylocystaceae bacterium]
MAGEYRQRLSQVKRLVVKVGSSSITYPGGKINLSRLEKLARELADLHNQGCEVILVSSGAMAAGLGRLKMKEMPPTIPVKQALAAIGQGALMQLYEKFFSEYSQVVAQVLLTRDDFAERVRYLNARNALTALLELGAIPIINENDTVAVEEIRFGDNDTLSALVTSIVSADLLIILTDIDGLYDHDPRLHAEAAIISQVTEIDAKIEANSRTRGSSVSSGGMYTKLQAARIAMNSGIPMVIARGEEGNIRRIINGEELGTVFIPRDEKMHARDRWLAFGSHPQGNIVVDDGAAEAIRIKGKSLLPSGIVRIEGSFDRGTVVSIIAAQNGELARGIVNYSSQEIAQIAGHRSVDIKKILGSKDYDEVIHRNNLALLSIQ